MSLQKDYVAKLVSCLEGLSQNDVISEGATQIFESLKNDGVWHLFGAGHSHMAVEEAFHRAGGLIPVNPWLETYLMPHAGPSRNGPMERLSGVAEVIFNTYGPKPGEVLTIISNSGINATSVEMAQIAKSKGVKTMAITNVAHAQKAKSRHASGKKLFEICDLVIDSKGIPGDAVIEVPGLDVKVAPMSTILAAATINLLAISVCEKYSQEGLVAPVYLSANLPGGDERNRKLEAKYQPRILRLQ